MANESSANAPTALEEPSASVAVPVPVPHEITLEQFAIELSLRDKRVGLVNGFVFVEKRARHFKDVESAYQARYIAFVTTPA
jgi:hypothetical protein